MAAPLMTWNQTPIETFTAGISTLSEFLTKLEAHIVAYSTYWQTSVLDPSGTKEYYEIKRKGTIAAVMTDFRMFLCGSAAGSEVTLAQQVDPHNQSNTNTQHTVFLCFAPNVAGTYPNGGSTTRWKTNFAYDNATNKSQTYYQKASARFDTEYSPDQMFLIECQDMLFVVTVRRSDQAIQVFGCGGIYQAPSVALGDPVRGDEIVWGQTSLGFSTMIESQHIVQGVNDDTNHGILFECKYPNTNKHRCAISHHLPVVGRLATSVANYGYGQKLYGTNFYQNETFGGSQSHGYWNSGEYADGTRASDPIGVSGFVSNYSRLGELRQIRAVFETHAHREVHDSAGALKGYDLAYRTSFDSAPGYFFSNDLNPT